MVVAAAVMQALAWAARGFAGSLYDGPNGMELAIFNDLCFCSLRSESGPPPVYQALNTPVTPLRTIRVKCQLILKRVHFGALIITASFTRAVL